MENQHNLTQEGTILGCIRRDSDGWRYLHTVEAILALGVTGPVIMPRSQNQANIGVGNSISESHALVGLLALLKATGSSHVEAQMLIQLHSDQCMASEQVVISWDEHWIGVKPIIYVPDQVLQKPSSEKRGIQAIHAAPDDAGVWEIQSTESIPAPDCNFVARYSG